MKTIKFVVCFLLFGVLISCQRDHLYYSSSYQIKVPISIDWSESGISPEKATAFVFNADGSFYKQFSSFNNPDTGTISLPVGAFSILVINNTLNKLSETMQLSGKDNLNTIKIGGILDEENTQKLTELIGTSDEYCILTPYELAIAFCHGVVTEEKMLNYTYDEPEDREPGVYPTTVTLFPRRITIPVSVKVHVKGLSNTKGVSTSFIRGFSSGYQLYSGENVDTAITHSFILNNRIFDSGSTTDGTIHAYFNSFGFLPKSDARYYIDLHFILSNGASYPVTMDITDKLFRITDVNKNKSVEISLEVEVPKTIGQGEDGGFNTDIYEWEDVEQDIQM